MSGILTPVASGVSSLSSTVAPRVPARERLLSLDVFRGLTIAGMLLVNNPGSWGAIYPPLRHAPWHGWTPTDLIFPFFLFIVGITTHLSLSVRRQRGDDERAIVMQVVKRGSIIFLLGLFLAGFPFIPRLGFDIATIRIPGVLQRIAVAYVAAALITLRTSLKTQVGILALFLFGYWLLMTLAPVPGQGGTIGALLLGQPDRTLAAYVDRLFLDGHIWKQTKTWDPEGVLSTIPAIGTVMLGIFAGRWIRSGQPLAERMTGLFATGSLAMVAGLMWHWSFPINKNLWTSSYVLFTAGMASVAIATCLWLIDVHRVTWWTKPFVIFGVNPIVAFVGSGMMARLMGSIIKVPFEGKEVSLQTAIYKSVFGSWLEPKNASLLYAVCFVLFWLALLSILHRRKIFLKV